MHAVLSVVHEGDHPRPSSAALCSDLQQTHLGVLGGASEQLGNPSLKKRDPAVVRTKPGQPLVISATMRDMSRGTRGASGRNHKTNFIRTPITSKATALASQAQLPPVNCKELKGPS